MIERQFVSQKIKEYQIQEFVAKSLANAGYSHCEIKRTPLGEKIIIYTTRPGLVVGSKGENIRKLTITLKKKFNMENPQIEIGEVGNPFLDSQFVADKISSTLERFGSKRFKSVGYKMLQNMMDAGALGAEIRIGGRGVPGARAKSWRFSTGHLKKSGDISENKIKRAQAVANLKSGTIGIKVSMMTPDIELPDKILFREIDKTIKIEEVKEPVKVEEIKKQEPKKAEKEKPKKEKTDGDNKKK